MWKKEEELGRCGVALFSHDEDDMWYIYYKFSHHMSGDRRKFHFMKRTKIGRVVLKVIKPHVINCSKKRLNFDLFLSQIE